MRAHEFLFLNLKEATIVQVGIDRNSNYLTNLNAFLGNPDEDGNPREITPFNVYINSGRKPKDKVLFKPDPGQNVTDAESVITGSIQNKKGDWVKLPGYTSNKKYIPLQVKHIHKSDDIKGATEKLSNKGETAEGWHAAAVFARFIARPDRDIDQADVENVINQLQLNEIYPLDVKEIENKQIADRFEIIVNLKPKSWMDFKDTKKISLQQAIFNNILVDANKETAKYAKEYMRNQNYDKINIIGDGVSGENTTKTDINFERETLKKKKGFSIKAGTTDQIDQYGGGPIKSSLKDRLEKLTFFNRLGADVMKVKKEFLAVKGKTEAERNVIAQRIAYKSVNKQINAQISGTSGDKKFLTKLISAIKHYIRKDEEGVALKQFTDKGYFILDVENLNKLEDNNDLNLESRYYEDGPGNPVVDIYDKVTEGEDGKIQATVIRFRTYKTSTGYLRTYVEKGPMLKHLTMAGGSEAYWDDNEGSRVKFPTKRSNLAQVSYDKRTADAEKEIDEPQINPTKS